MAVLYLDTETCGFQGLIVLIQYAIDDGEIVLYEPWFEPVKKTLDLIEWICTQEIVGFNLVFDWFHLSKLYTTLRQFLIDGGDPNTLPIRHIDEIAICEEKARFLDICIKPRSALDLMLHGRKTAFQSLMKRKDVRIRKVPAIIAERLRSELEQRVNIDGIYFRKRKDKTAPRWSITNHKDKTGKVYKDFMDVVLKFKPEAGLKALAEHVLKIPHEEILGIEIDPRFFPKEVGYAPFAMAIGKPGRWNGAWPDVIKEHIYHWKFKERARKYATNDIKYTRGLRQHEVFADAQMGDDDSILACAVASVRWHGFNVNNDRIIKQRQKALEKKEKTPTDPGAVKRWLSEVMDSDETTIFTREGTKDTVLEEIGGREEEHKCECKGLDKNCTNCGGEGTYLTYTNYWETESGDTHPAAFRARLVREARSSGKEIELYDKLLLAKRFHASLVVIGTKSTRMSGSDDLNPQGIMGAKGVRACFVFTDNNNEEQLDGGDFDSFEVAISAAVFNDKGLEKDLRAGKKLHALMAEAIFPEVTYEEIMKSKGSTTGKDYYTDGKRGVFGLNYGGNENTLVNRLKVSLDRATDAFNNFNKRYPNVKKYREGVAEKFCSMRQPGGVGTQVVWHEPAEYIESLLGFRRYFKLENSICRALFELAQDPPKEWRDIKVKVVRRERVQTASGACQSALYGAAFNIQGQCLRAGTNHVIQSTGGGITKKLQRNIWDIQPSGVNPFLVRPFNCHDEVLTVDKKKVQEEVNKIVDSTVKSFVPIIPLIKLEWKLGMKSWAEK